MANLNKHLLGIAFALSLAATPVFAAPPTAAAPAPIAQSFQLAQGQSSDPTLGQNPYPVPATAEPPMGQPPIPPPPPAEIPKPFHGSLSFEAGGGKIVTLTLPAANIYVADPKVAEVRPASSTSLFVFGVGAGHTTIAAVDLLGRLLADYDITVRPSGFGAREAQAAISRLVPNSQVLVKAQGRGLILTGAVATAGDASQAVSIAKGFAGTENSTVSNQMSIATPSQVTLMVRMAEMKRSVVRNLGIDWSAQGLLGKGALFGTGGASRLLSATFNGASCAGGTGCVDTILTALAKDGLAHILAEPNLTVMSGQPASFQAGGEYPYPELQGGGSSGSGGTVTIAFKPYGVLVNFLPTVLSDGRINLHVKPEVSQLDSTNQLAVSTGTSASLSVPALTVRRAETTVELGSGESFAIAGMLQTTDSDNNSGIPGIGELPVLGALFKTNTMNREQTELVIIVTPLLVRPVRNAAQLQLPGDGYKPQTDFKRVMLNRQMPNADGTVTSRRPANEAGFIVR